MPACPDSRHRGASRSSRPRLRLARLLLAPLLLLATALAGCATGPTTADRPAADGTVQVVIGYQSKTINTVTAGTLLRSLGYFEQRLHALGARTGTTYQVSWQDYSAGAPITAQMLAGKIDIGSMGDYPLLINGSRAAQAADDRTTMISVTGYNLLGALNMVVTRPDSPATGLADLRGKPVSTSVGSAAHGTLVQALRAAGLDPASAVSIQNQDPAVGASALAAGSVAGLAQFVAWPGLLVFQNQAKLVYDGSALGVPTLHGVVVRNAFRSAHADVVEEFLRAQLDATRYLHEHPLDAAQSVAAATGLPAEVVYLYNGANGMVSFDPTIKPVLRDALRADTGFLGSIGNIGPLDVNAFVDDSALRQAYGPGYDAALTDTTNPSRITGTDQSCGIPVTDQRRAGELWLAGEPATHPAATASCLLRAVASARGGGKQVRAAYVSDAATGTRWFADKAWWLRDPAAPPTDRYLPFTTRDGAQRYASTHPGSTPIDFATAVIEAGGQP
jgi:NitT/TauT family transport system substrate-binding protein